MGSLGLLAVVSGTATALTGMRRTHLWRQLSGHRQAALEFEARIGSYRSSLVIVRVAGLVGAIAMATLLAADLSDLRWWAILVSGVGSALLIVIAEAPLRSAAARDPSRIIRLMALPLALLNALARPLTRLLPLSSEAAFSYSFAGPVEQIGSLAEAQSLRQLAAEAQRPGLAEDERKMIRAILALNQTTVKEIMVPRPDIAAVSTEATLPEAAKLLVETGHNRLPLYEGTLDNVVGVIYARDVLGLLSAQAAPADLRQVARQPYFVPETKPVSDLLRDFQEKAVHFALVVDEYGGVEGLVSLNDVLEEIVGEIEGEFEPAENAIDLLNEGEAIVDGVAPLEQLNEIFATELEGDGFETIGGYVQHHLGRIPKAGEKLEAAGLMIEVLSTIGRRIKKLRVKKLLPQQEEAKASSSST